MRSLRKQTQGSQRNSEKRRFALKHFCISYLCGFCVSLGEIRISLIEAENTFLARRRGGAEKFIESLLTPYFFTLRLSASAPRRESGIFFSQ